MDLTGTVAVVTGSGRGPGLGLVLELACPGAERSEPGRQPAGAQSEAEK